jgi:hypothetical protein
MASPAVLTAITTFPAVTVHAQQQGKATATVGQPYSATATVTKPASATVS